MKLLRDIDLKLVLPAALLLILGGAALSSVSPGSYPNHFFHVLLGALVFLFFAKLDTRILRELASSFYVLSLLLLAVTLFIGTVTRGSVRWIELGPVNIQPSEIVKPLLVVFFAWLVTREGDGKRFLAAAAALVLAALLILVQPDLGSALVVIAGFLGVIFLAGISVRLLLAALVGAVISSPILWGLLADYQRQRIASFLNPASDPLGSGYNAIQAIIAVGSGGFFGRGLGQGTQSQLAFLPERHTDFIFAALAEELGFLGSLLVVAAFGFLLLRLLGLLKDAEENFHRALLGGIFFIVFTQASINIGMNLGMLPITGIPLPFVSAGGSSLVSMSALLGIASSSKNSLKRGMY